MADLELMNSAADTIVAPEKEQQGIPVVTPEPETELPTPQPPVVEQEATQKRKRPLALIFAALGIGAIAAGSYGYRWWQYASTHEATDNAAVAGHVHQVSSRINGTVTDVPVDDNQSVQKGQVLVKLDP